MRRVEDDRVAETPHDREATAYRRRDCCSRMTIHARSRGSALLPHSSTFFTTLPISHGEETGPFLTLTTLPVFAAAISRSVCRQRNAGICRTSTTSAASVACSSVWTSVRIGTPTLRSSPSAVSPVLSRTRASKRINRGSIRLIVGRFENIRHAERLGYFSNPMRRFHHELFALDDAGTGDQKMPMPSADFKSSYFNFVNHVRPYAIRRCSKYLPARPQA